MKKIILLFAFLLPVIGLIAQSDKYVKAMQQQIDKLDGAFQSGSFPELANNFERIGDAEKTQWLPYYYSAYANVMTAYMEKDKTKVDNIADKAEAMITKAETLAGKSNSEIEVIKSMVASSRMMVDPQNRWMQYGQASAGHISKAKELDPANPRPVYLEAQSKFYTPEQFGGGKSVAAPLFEKALSMFGTFKPVAEMFPTWGKSSAEYFLSLCK
jgi:hypothetical protein